MDRSAPRIVPTWQVPARTSAYPRTAPAIKQIETPNISDLSMPKADKRLIRLEHEYSNELARLQQEMSAYINLLGNTGDTMLQDLL